MEKPAFDAVARGVSQVHNRRTALAAALGLGLANSGAAAGKKGKKKKRKNKKKCPPGADLTTDICCTYQCPEQPNIGFTYKYYCLSRAVKGKTVCANTFRGCSLSDTAFGQSVCNTCHDS